jgi:hypothetical protein
MSIWAGIKKTLNTDLTTPLNTLITTARTTITTAISGVDTKVTTTNTNLGAQADAASATGSLHAKVKELKNYLAGKNIIAYGTAIKSIQKGSISFPAGSSTSYSATISSVSTSKAFVILLGVEGTGTDPARFLHSVDLTNSTTVTASKGLPDPTHGYNVRYVVIEFY